jgi:hypothetical protein
VPILNRPEHQNPDFWHVFGHSYVSQTGGTYDQTGRPDALLRGALDIEFSSWANHARNGAILTIHGRLNSGWTRVMQERVQNLLRGGPYAPDGGAALLFWGINDLGLMGNDPQMKASYKNALRAVISRCRASRIYEDTDATITYGAGFTNLGGVDDIGSGSSCRQCTTLGTGTVTYTLPSDYKGETVTFQFWGMPHATGNGGTVTFGGTAGYSGPTLYTGAAMPAGTLAFTPIVRRITGLTSANAGQTITATVTSLDAGGTVYFDCAWLEALAPNIVLVTNINRLTATGYAFYGGWTGTEAQKDADVLEWNGNIASVIAEFDQAVQVVDIDGVIAKDPAITSDGIHPNEYGGGEIVDACLIALRRASSVGGKGATANFNTPAPRTSPMLVARLSGFWHSPEYTAYGTAYTAVAGDQFAMPFWISEARDRWTRIGVEATNSVTGTSVRWGIYDSSFLTAGYPFPQNLWVEPTSAGAFAITSGAGVKQSPTSGTGSFTFIPDPGLYWLVIKFTVIGVAHTFQTLKGPNRHMPSQTSTGLGGTAPSSWKLTGQGTTALPSTYPQTGSALVDPSPMVNLLKA